MRSSFTRPVSVRLSSAILLLSGSLLGSTAARAADDDLFRRSVAPIFERHCLSCHQGAEPKGGLSLTDRRGALAGGDSGAVVVPGDAAASFLVEQISGDKPHMPPEGPPLTAAQVTAIRDWIAAGARWPADLKLTDKHVIDGPWWSLEPLSSPPVPATDSAWVRTPIDAFVLARLQAAGLEPSPQADRRTLIRRLTYDLHGLPPTPAEVAAFVADADPLAYERLVDRLLASPRYGERWGRHWLDVVHYGDTHGYDKDKPRPHAWPYRDYVIGALNADKPYGRFVAEQVAGDVLFADDPQATVATGFLAAGPWDLVGHTELREGTVDKEIARSNDRDDMVATTASTFLSLTVHCARCHNHKFDPILQSDYYRLQAVFAGVDRANRPYDADPQVARRRTELAAALSDVTARQARLEQQMLAAIAPALQKLDDEAAERSQQLAALPIEPDRRSTTLGYHSQIAPDANQTKWVQIDLGQDRLIDEVVLVPAHVVYGGHPGPGFAFPLRFKVSISATSEFDDAATKTIADYTAADFPNPGDAPLRIAVPGERGRFVRVTATRLWKRTDDWCFALAEMAVLSAGVNIAPASAVSAFDSIEAAPSWAQKNLVDGYSSLERVDLDIAGVASPRQSLTRQIERLQAERRRLMDESVDATARAQLTALADERVRLQAELAALPPRQTVYAATHEFADQGSFRPARQPRPIFRLERGDVRSPREEVAPGGVVCVPGPSADFGLGAASADAPRRAALAHWLSDPANAIVRRSIVNRVWKYHFGQGIVATPNDFGRMGARPSHPELLDWLAGWLLDQGESLKALHRLIVTSAAYRQVSDDRPAASQIDADNRLLWRMQRTKLDAECVRDSLLYVSGQLDTSMGGPAVQQFFFQDDHSPVYDYERFDVDDPRSRRRSVYRFLVRSVPDPFMDNLDCADPSISVPQRNLTLTAMQALALYNDRFVLRLSLRLAERVAALKPALPGQIEALYQLTLGRAPTESERQSVADHVARFGLPSACRVLLNSNEFMFID